MSAPSGAQAEQPEIAVRVLVVDDDPQIVRALRINLTAHGYHVVVAGDGASALRAAADRRPDVVVLDLGLPDLDGTDVIAGIRGWTSIPIIVLSARTDSADKVTALDAGADDYVTKPFGMAELLARLRAAVRRAGTDTVDGVAVVEIGRFTVDLQAKRVTRDGVAVHLTPTEWGILEVLVRHRGKLVAQRDLLRHVWGPRYDDRTNYLRVYLAQLRRKLEDDPARPRHLITEPGMGYRLDE
jgi:two-component system KDP operon response regulator KdpE